MYSPQVEKMFEQLILAAENLSTGHYGDHNQIFAMTDSEQYPPLIARFAEAFGMMAVQIEAREFRLEQMITDLTATRDQLSLTNIRLEESLVELKQTQMQLIQQAKLETVGRLAAGVAHEVKNPLAIIQLGVDFLANELKGNPVQYETVMDMEDAVQRADSVIKGLLDFSRSEQLDLKEADIRKVIHDSLLLVRHELNSRHVTVEWIKDEQLPLMMLDKNKLKQVFINLLMNAMHAMPEGGTVHISASLHRLTAEEISLFSGDSLAAGENSVIIRIADTGTGISDDAASRLFDPFFTTKPVGVGTGLGLSVTRKILELHNATITLQNRSDCKGAEARLLFKI